jgi:hypothetical protein
MGEEHAEMWERRPRSVRTEVVTVDVDRLARHAFHHHLKQADLVTLTSEEVAPGKYMLRVHPISSFDGDDGALFWPRTRVEKLLKKIVSLEAVPWKATEVEGGVLVETDAGTFEDVRAACGDWPQSVGEAEVHARIADVKIEIERHLVRLQVTGAMKGLNGQFKALRAQRIAAGEKAPQFKKWMSEQLETLILQRIASGETAEKLFEPL